MGEFANNFTDAFDALQKGASPEPIEAEPEEAAHEPTSEPEEGNDAPKVALKKGAESEELVQYIDADEFLKAQIELLDSNAMTTESALNGNIQATALLVKGLVGLSERVEELHTKLDSIASQPAGSSPAMSEAEAAAMQKSIVTQQPHGEPPPAPPQPLNNATLVAQANAELRKAFDATTEGDPGKLDLRNDLVLLESSAGTTPVQEIVPRMSQKGRTLLTNALRAPDAE